MTKDNELRALLEDRLCAAYEAGRKAEAFAFKKSLNDCLALLSQPAPAAEAGAGALQEKIAAAVDSALEREDVYEGIWDGESDTAGLCLRIADAVIAALPALQPQAGEVELGCMMCASLSSSSERHYLNADQALDMVKRHVKKFASQKEAAKELGITPQFLCDVLKGFKRPHSIMRKLGWQHLVYYKPILTPPSTGDAGQAEGV